MIHLNEVPWDFDPRRKILTTLSKYFNAPEECVRMVYHESAFLCGALKKFRPKKILEVGVGPGGSTLIILQTLEDIGEPYEMHSIDLNEKLYLNRRLDTGFLIKFSRDNNLLVPPQSTLQGKHAFHLGKYLPQVIDSIGGDIDFVILDTVHSMPGEGLDFLAVLPYLTDNAIVVLHDVSLCQTDDQTNNATTALFSAVTAEKFLNFHPDGELFRYPNIAAFQVNGQTRDNIENVFLSLILRWAYLPSEAELVLYREHYRRFYPAELCAVFQEAIDMNAYNFYLMQRK